MGSLSLGEAAEKARTSKVGIWRAIREGRLSAQRTDGGGFVIDPAELFRVFETQRSEQPAMEQDARAATEAFGHSGTSSTPEPAETNDIAVAFAVLGAELKDLLGLPVEKRSATELHQQGPERQAAEFTELAAVHAATAEKAIAEADKPTTEYASLAERLAAIAEVRRRWGGVSSADGAVPQGVPEASTGAVNVSENKVGVKSNQERLACSRGPESLGLWANRSGNRRRGITKYSDPCVRAACNSLAVMSTPVNAAATVRFTSTRCNRPFESR